jgi:AraC-like DNA-binding protein
VDCHFNYLRCPELPGVEYLEASALPSWRWYLARSVWIAPVSWEGEVECHQQRHRLSPGRLLYADPDDVCRAVHVDRRGTLSALFIDSSRYRPLSAPAAPDRAPPPLERFAAFSQAIRSGAPAAQLRAQISGLLDSAASPCPELLRCQRAARATTRIAARLREWIDCDCRREQSLTSLAERLGVTRFQALRAFKQHFGLTPSAYQMCLRIAGARDALRGGATPAEVAADYGFSDQSHLGRHFKRELGVSPGRYSRPRLASPAPPRRGLAAPRGGSECGPAQARPKSSVQVARGPSRLLQAQASFANETSA